MPADPARGAAPQPGVLAAPRSDVHGSRSGRAGHIAGPSVGWPHNDAVVPLSRGGPFAGDRTAALSCRVKGALSVSVFGPQPDNTYIIRWRTPPQDILPSRITLLATWRQGQPTGASLPAVLERHC